MSDQQKPEQPAEQPNEPKPAEAVGYCRPPVHSQWKKGQSGNPSGRRKDTPNLNTALERQLSHKVTIREGETSRSISRLDAVIVSVASRAIKGDQRASALILAYAEKLLSSKAVEPQQEISADDEAILAEFLARQVPEGDANG